MTQTQTQTVLITGAGGFLGSLVADTLLRVESSSSWRFILADVSAPRAPKTAGAAYVSLQADLTTASGVASLFTTEFGTPHVIYSLHGIMSKGSEDNWDLGFKVNFDSTRALLDAARARAPGVTFVFASSVGVFGGKLPPQVTPETAATPEGAYGTAKVMCEYLVTEYSRKGFVDGRVIRLPYVIPNLPIPAPHRTASY